MNGTHRIQIAMAALGCLMVAGCHAPGMPGAPEPRPDKVADFDTLYKENCAACHGEKGHRGLATSLANPVYIAIAGKDAIRRATAEGGPGRLMPAFARSSGGILTGQQVDILADGIVKEWGNTAALNGAAPPEYASSAAGDPEAGKKAFDSFCVRCHAVKARAGSLLEPAYLALISDQGLRTTILSGRPDEGMPDWRGVAPQPLTGRQVTDIVAWLSSQRPAPKGMASTTAAQPAAGSEKPGRGESR